MYIKNATCGTVTVPLVVYIQSLTLWAVGLNDETEYMLCGHQP